MTRIVIAPSIAVGREYVTAYGLVDYRIITTRMQGRGLSLDPADVEAVLKPSSLRPGVLESLVPCFAASGGAPWLIGEN